MTWDRKSWRFSKRPLNLRKNGRSWATSMKGSNRKKSQLKRTGRSMCSNTLKSGAWRPRSRKQWSDWCWPMLRSKACGISFRRRIWQLLTYWSFRGNSPTIRSTNTSRSEQAATRIWYPIPSILIQRYRTMWRPPPSPATTRRCLRPRCRHTHRISPTTKTLTHTCCHRITTAAPRCTKPPK